MTMELLTAFATHTHKTRLTATVRWVYEFFVVVSEWVALLDRADRLGPDA